MRKCEVSPVIGKQEPRTGLRYVFSILDQNKDGVIAAGELLLTLRALNVTLTEAELNDVIAELDVDCE